MIQDTKISKKRFTVILALSFFIYGILLMTLFYLFSEWLIAKKETEQFRSEVYLEADTKERFLKLYIKDLTKSLQAIAYNPYFLSYIDNKAYIDSAKFLFLTIMLEHNDYMQLRFIDKNGMERIRYERDRAGDKPVESKYLQNKSHRYYFIESTKQKEGTVYTSNIDFNMENGKVVYPVVPVFRVSMPIYSHGKLKGILAINTFAKEIIDIFTSSSVFETVIFDSRGLLIYYKDKFYDAKLNPVKIENIIQIPHSAIPTKLHSEYISKRYKIYIRAMQMGTQRLNVALIRKKDTQLSLKSEDYKAVGLVLLLLFVLAFPLSYLLSRPTERMYDTLAKQSKELEELNHTLEDRVKTKTQENAKKDRLIIHQARLAELGEMIANIAHQWRHPLTRLSLILQNINALSKRGKLEVNRLDIMLTQAKEQIEFMSETIDNFKDFYTPSAHSSKFLLSQAYSKAIEIIGYDLKHKNIDIRYKENKKISLYGKSNQFAQVLLSLISNAKDAHLYNKTQKPVISIVAKAKQNSITIYISDNGGGIDCKYMDKIFEPYFSTKEDKGTGIGLYMVKTIIEERFNGKIRVKSNKNGATFIVVLNTQDSLLATSELL